MQVPALKFTPVRGGDINEAGLLETKKGRFFVKFNPAPSAFAMLSTEVKGLDILRKAGVIRIPEILLLSSVEGTSFLLLEYIESGEKNATFWKSFGTQLALLHRKTSEYFGLDHSNFIGSLEQANDFHSGWPDFFISERMLPQIDLAKRHNRIPVSLLKSFETLFKMLESLLPEEPPALTHGDLWSGNYVVGKKNQPVLIDPSVSYAHREMDLSMSRLFGGFDQQFYQSYQATYPLHPGFEERMEIYQLYYLMVHVNLFGGSYLHSVESILHKYT